MGTDAADLQNSLTEDSMKVKNLHGFTEGIDKRMGDRPIGSCCGAGVRYLTPSASGQQLRRGHHEQDLCGLALLRVRLPSASRTSHYTVCLLV